ncbi:MAG: hypothetical protein KJ787_02920 [Gammaproteobacteria bacterium]|nr:hypothetical protein [Gammaproteobacteria bacterium]MBU1645266.1 hypothetical protein [Gammaproteobacteria bacterium]MBU1971603.1 hypothetical protein [Gammaproteobacteria bacterium]
MQVHLALPGLLWPERALPDVVFDLDLPALSWLLGRARRRQSAPLPFETWLARRFGLESDQPPAAALRRLGEPGSNGEPGSGDWICADPVHLAFEHGHPLLADPAALDLQADEIAEIAVALAPTFSTVGKFSLQASGHGYVALAAPAAILAAPLSTAVGRGAAMLLPRGDDAARWVRLANEAQIALHALELNQRREAAGRPTINTLWFWGSGRLPDALTTPYQKVGGGGTLARGLARHAGLPWQAAGDSMTGNSDTLLIDDRLLAPARQLDAGAWRHAMLALDREVLAPLAADLRRGRLGQLTISAPGDETTLDLELGRSDTLRFWRRPRSLADALAP